MSSEWRPGCRRRTEVCPDPGSRWRATDSLWNLGGSFVTRVLHCSPLVRRLAIAAILAISLGAPIAELFDTWDQALPTGGDSEANVMVVALCIGVVFAIGTIAIVNRIR